MELHEQIRELKHNPEVIRAVRAELVLAVGSGGIDWAGMDGDLRAQTVITTIAHVVQGL